MESIREFDGHLMRAKHICASRRMVTKMVEKVLTMLGRMRSDLNLEYELNTFEDGQKDGVPKDGLSFIWFKDTRVWNAIAGKNFDGTPRVSVKKVKKEVVHKEESSSAVKSTRWGDMSDDEEEEEFTTVESPLPSLVLPEHFAIKMESKEDKADYVRLFLIRMKNEDEDIEGVAPLVPATLKLEYIDPMGAISDRSAQNNVLKGRIPLGVELERLLVNISKFSSSLNPQFPQITRSGETVWIVFDPKTKDALISAKQMRIKLYYKDSVGTVRAAIFAEHPPVRENLGRVTYLNANDPSLVRYRATSIPTQQEIDAFNKNNLAKRIAQSTSPIKRPVASTSRAPVTDNSGFVAVQGRNRRR